MFDFLTVFAACGQNDKLLGIFPTWYKYLEVGGADCNVTINALSDIYKIGAAILEMLLAGAGVLAVGFIIAGGIRFITSLGDPTGIKQARDMIINAVVGLVIAIMSTVIVSFIAGKF